VIEAQQGNVRRLEQKVRTLDLELRRACRTIALLRAERRKREADNVAA
jgi:hypothetical protein